MIRKPKSILDNPTIPCYNEENISTKAREFL